MDWRELLRVDPVPPLLDTGDPALDYFVRRDLLEEKVVPVVSLWELPAVAKIVRKQQEDGSWRYAGKHTAPTHNYDLLETFRQVGILVEQYGLTRQHPAMARAAEYFFSCQTDEGDFRGIIGNQYMPYYSGVIMERLIRAGYGDDPRLAAAFEWLIAARQADGGWAAACRTLGIPWEEADARGPLQPDRARPHQHLMTGMALRAFAVHPTFCTHPAARIAAERLKERFFHADAYSDRRTPDYWLKFQYPFWWTNLLTGLDTLAWLGYRRTDPQVFAALEWFFENQQPNGLWPLQPGAAPDAADDKARWVALAIGRVFKHYFRS